MHDKELAIEVLRDILTHHYADINAEAIFNTCKEKIPILRETIEKMMEEL